MICGDSRNVFPVCRLVHHWSKLMIIPKQESLLLNGHPLYDHRKLTNCTVYLLCKDGLIFLHCGMYNINQCLVWVVKQLNGLWKYQIIGNRVRFNWYFSKASTLIKANRSFHSILKSWKPIQVELNRIKNFLSTRINFSFWVDSS